MHSICNMPAPGTSGKEPACQCRRCKRREFDPWVRKIPWRRKWQPTPISLPGESYGQWRLAGHCREPAYCILSAYRILHIECSTFTASSFRIWNSSTGSLSLPGASVRNPSRGKGHEEGGSAYAKAGSSLRSPPGNSQASTPKTRVCLLSALCFHLHL